MREPHRPHGLRPRRLMRLLLWLCVWVYLVTSPFLLYFVISVAHAGATGAPLPAPSSQDSSWVAAKLAFRVARPTPPGEGFAAPACAGPCASYPAAYVLDTGGIQ